MPQKRSPPRTRTLCPFQRPRHSIQRTTAAPQYTHCKKNMSSHTTPAHIQPKIPSHVQPGIHHQSHPPTNVVPDYFKASYSRSPSPATNPPLHVRPSQTPTIAIPHTQTSGVGRGGERGLDSDVQVRGFPYAFAYIFRFCGAQNHTVTTAKLRELSRPGM